MKDSDPSEMGNKWGDPHVCSAYCLERVSRTYYKERESGRNGKTPWVEEREWRIWGTLRQPVFARQSKTAAAAAAKSLQSCPTLCDPKDSSPPAAWWLPRPWDSPGKNTGVGCHFLLQSMKVKSESEVPQSCLTLWDPVAAAYQAPLSMGFSRQEYWSGLPLPSPQVRLDPLK